MSKQIRQLIKELRFIGGRFERNKGWLDFDVLPELLAYKKILIETAKEEWRRKNPDRERLPRNFEENFCLGFHELRQGSCEVPVERIIEVDDDAMDLYVADELDDALKIIDATLVSVRDDTTFPDNFPARVIPMFEEWGRTLSAEEGIELSGKDGVNPRYDLTLRNRLLNTKMEKYEDQLDLIGEIRAAELKMREGGSFSILLENGDLVPGNFSEAQESSITEALKEHRILRLRIIGWGEFEATGRIKRILRVDHLEERMLGETPYDPDAPPVWESIMKIGESIPEDKWNKAPSDLATNLDHYLYGNPTEDEE